MKYGWWKVETEKEINALTESFHWRGIREKQLQRTLLKHKKYCVESLEISSRPGNLIKLLKQNYNGVFGLLFNNLPKAITSLLFS